MCRAAPWSLGLLMIAACAVRDDLPAGANTARAVSKPAASAIEARGETQLVVRTFDSAGQEILGAACKAEASLFAAEVLTPGRILLPYYAEASPPVLVSCTSGTLVGSRTVGIQSTRSGGGVAWPSVGVSVNSEGGVGLGLGLGYYGGRSGPSETAYVYPPVDIVLN